MSATHRRTRRPSALLAALLIALATLPAAATARPALNGPGPRSDVSVKASELTPAPTVVRTVVKEDALNVLPIALAGAALLIAMSATGYMLIRITPIRHQLGGEH
jgi:hypothetical protein